MIPHITRSDTLLCRSASHPLTHDSLLPSALREFQTDLAGRLALLDEPGAEMKALRERYGFTQDALAKLLRMRRESLSRVETGSVSLTLDLLQRFTRIVTLARGVREQLAFAEARGNHPDERMFDRLAQSLRLDKESADEVVLLSMIAYDKKRRETLRALPGGASALAAGPRRLL